MNPHVAEFDLRRCLTVELESNAAGFGSPALFNFSGFDAIEFDDFVTFKAANHKFVPVAMTIVCIDVGSLLPLGFDKSFLLQSPDESPDVAHEIFRFFAGANFKADISLMAIPD